jgi:hypothetical protein
MDVSRSVRAAFHPGPVAMDLWLTPGLAYRGTAESVERALQEWDGRPPRAIIDLTASIGELYGALGVLQCAAACVWLRTNRGRTAVTTTGACWGDGSSSLIVTSAPEKEQPDVRTTTATTRPQRS